MLQSGQSWFSLECFFFLRVCAECVHASVKQHDCMTVCIVEETPTTDEWQGDRIETRFGWRKRWSVCLSYETCTVNVLARGCPAWPLRCCCEAWYCCTEASGYVVERKDISYRFSAVCLGDFAYE
uniref:Putative secreted protein n=1 Tax=Rhipicephalus microplus TaxID=6941 RepID=A0A6M2DCH2_RHIMP